MKITDGLFLTEHRKLFNPQLTLSLTWIDKIVYRTSHQSDSYAGKHRINFIVIHKARSLS